MTGGRASAGTDGTPRERDSWGGWPLVLPALGLYVPAVLWSASLAGAPEPAGGAAELRGAWAALGRTLIVAGGGAVLAGLIGSTEALLLEGFAVRFRALLSALLLLPFLLPAAALTTAIHLTLAGGPAGFLTWGLAGSVFISGVQMAPVVMWGTARSLAGVPSAERNALRSALSPRAGALRVLLPRALPAAVRMMLLVALLLLPQMEIPSYTGVETIGVRILAAFTSGGNDAEGWLLVLGLILVVAPGLRVAAAMLGGAAPQALGEERAWDRVHGGVATTILLGGVALFTFVPLVVMVAEAGSSLAPLAPLAREAPALGLESLRAAGTAVLVTLLGWRLADSRSAVARGLFALPLFLPGGLPAIALLAGVQPVLPSALLDLPILVSLAQGTRFAGVALVLGSIASATLPRAERQASQAVPPMRRRWRILLPRALPALATSTLLITVLILGEVECANLLLPPGYDSPVKDLHQFLHFRYDADAARVSLLLASTTGLLSLLLSRLGRGLR